MTVSLVVARQCATLHKVPLIPEGPDRLSAVLEHLRAEALLDSA